MISFHSIFIGLLLLVCYDAFLEYISLQISDGPAIVTKSKKRTSYSYISARDLSKIILGYYFESEI